MKKDKGAINIFLLLFLLVVLALGGGIGVRWWQSRTAGEPPAGKETPTAKEVPEEPAVSAPAKPVSGKKLCDNGEYFTEDFGEYLGIGLTPDSELKLRQGGFNLKEIADLKCLEYLPIGGYEVSDITPLSKLINLNHLSLTNTQVSDITPLKGLVKLDHLDLQNTEVSNITSLKKLVNLRWLNLRNTKVSDLSPLKDLINLKHLDLSNTEVSDVTSLKKLVNLQRLDLTGTQVSKSDCEALKITLPKTVITPLCVLFK